MIEKRKMPRGRPFEKGNQFGARSSKRLNEFQKKASKRLKGIDGKMMLAGYLFMEFKDFKKALREGKGTAFEMLIMRIIERGIAKADTRVIQFVFDRLGWTEDKDNSILADKKRLESIQLNYKVEELVHECEKEIEDGEEY